MQKKPKSINALMAYMRDEKGLNISGSSDKKNIKYYLFDFLKNYSNTLNSCLEF